MRPIQGLPALVLPTLLLATPPAQEPVAGQAAVTAEELKLLPGFEADLLYTVPRDTQGSWVSVTTGPDGELYASDQGKMGIYRIEPADPTDPNSRTTARKLAVEVSGAQGMCWAFDSLYANVNGQGLWRITDSDGDGELDTSKLIVPLGGGGEHGPHAVILRPDGEGLFFLGGNHTNPPAFDGSQLPTNWDEDLLLPRHWDARGHARGKLAPGGWIASCDPDGTNIQIISTGYRNQYDIDINPQGEMFTYDADMEWDLGSPWYRPTRVCHVTSGSEFGWRSGTGKWPVYFEDSSPPAIEIGPGSPTGIVFGTGAKFPARYQRALFILDWTFGTIYAIHLEPDGATYTGTKEDFVWSKPLAVTDAIIGQDGALYFAVGGRGSQSALYRVRYTGDASTEPAEILTAGASERAERRALEAHHGGTSAGAVDAAWPYLSSDDRSLRYAARVAIENQPVDTWRSRALEETDPQASVTGLIALCRQGQPEDLGPVMAALDRLDLAEADHGVALGALRAYALAFIRLGAPDDATRARLASKLDAMLPSDSASLNTELVRLLTYLGAPSVVSKTVDILVNGAAEPVPKWGELAMRNDRYGGPIKSMMADMPPTSKIGYAFMLRNAEEGWTFPLRKAYFQFFVDASKKPGGMSYPGFLTNMRRDAEQRLDMATARALAPLLGESLYAPTPDNVTPPQGPGRTWAVDAALASFEERKTGRDFESGKNLYHATTCSTCHRFAGSGGGIGPDLTSVANKFSTGDLLEAILEPSKIISDQYGSHLVADKDGRVAEGLMAEEPERVLIYTSDTSAPPVVFDRDEIEVLRPSALSQMPAGLVDALNPDELADLLAYLLSGGNAKGPMFKEAGGQ